MGFPAEVVKRKCPSKLEPKESSLSLVDCDQKIGKTLGNDSYRRTVRPQLNALIHS